MESEFDWLTLDEGEEVLWADTPHQYSLVPALVVGIPLSLFLVGVPIVVSAYLTYKNTNYVVTSAALYKKTGVLSRSVQRIEFDKVQDTSYSQSFFGGQFGYGTVDISTAGGAGVELSFQSVSDPQELQTLINGRIRTREAPADDKATVLDDILGELRAIRQAVEGEESTTPPADATATAATETDEAMFEHGEPVSVDESEAADGPAGDDDGR
ncbi:PH domain-containing protein [Halogranum gelatinilyticum]|uniref:PH domain-containing protein n=1 Tax=Halogranum gelatinilyticum TaxID=660521 RepID=A0A1G9ZG09_9EURY|nr:PH domain-containing protein [Halogranum gelatinilyticum]SDN19506.1 PH domain-containing protein [Halogranum gelatinilyticum]